MANSDRIRGCESKHVICPHHSPTPPLKVGLGCTLIIYIYVCVCFSLAQQTYTKIERNSIIKMCCKDQGKGQLRRVVS